MLTADVTEHDEENFISAILKKLDPQDKGHVTKEVFVAQLVTLPAFLDVILPNPLIRWGQWSHNIFFLAKQLHQNITPETRKLFSLIQSGADIKDIKKLIQSG